MPDPDARKAKSQRNAKTTLSESSEPTEAKAASKDDDTSGLGLNVPPQYRPDERDYEFLEDVIESQELRKLMKALFDDGDESNNPPDQSL